MAFMEWCLVLLKMLNAKASPIRACGELIVIPSVSQQHFPTKKTTRSYGLANIDTPPTETKKYTHILQKN
jgi:hypothetical protein